MYLPNSVLNVACRAAEGKSYIGVIFWSELNFSASHSRAVIAGAVVDTWGLWTFYLFLHRALFLEPFQGRNSSQGGISLLKNTYVNYSLFLDLETFCHSNTGIYGIVFIPELVLPRYFLHVWYLHGFCRFQIQLFSSPITFSFGCKCIETIIGAIL